MSVSIVTGQELLCLPTEPEPDPDDGDDGDAMDVDGSHGAPLSHIPIWISLTYHAYIVRLHDAMSRHVHMHMVHVTPFCCHGC